jgi:hypothetical protein
MAANRLNESPEGFIEMLEEHIVYEARMLRATFMALAAPGLDMIVVPAIRNALIESFCSHARLLQDFFECQTSAAGEEVCACHFTDAMYPFQREMLPDRLRGKLNAQILHLSYNRTKIAERKIGHEERVQLFRVLENEIEAFGLHLKEAYKPKWPDDLKGRVIATA